MKIHPSILAITLPIALAIPRLVYADTIPGIGSGPVNQIGFTPGNSDSANNVLNTLWDRIVTRAVLPILGGLAVIYIIVSGLQYITSTGNAEKAKKAKQNIINTLLGIIVLMTIYTIIGLILGTARYLASKAQG